MFSQNMSNCQELFRVWKDEALGGGMLKFELVSEAGQGGAISAAGQGAAEEALLPRLAHTWTEQALLL